MKIPSEFDPIRPFEPEELPAVYDRILADNPQYLPTSTHLCDQKRITVCDWLEFWNDRAISPW